MRRTLACCLFAALAGCASTPADPDARESKGQNIAPYESHEECLTLGPGDRLDYRFSSTSAVTFNIRYRENNAIISPIVREGVTADSGIFQPVARHTFCLAWEAGPVPVLVSSRAAGRRRGP